MLRPSYSDLLEIVSKDKLDSFETGSRYTIVIAAAKRAREIVDHQPILAEGCDPNKPVSTAVKELYEGKIKIGYAENDEILADENAEEIDYEAISVVSDDIFKASEDEEDFDDFEDDSFEE